MRLVYGMVVVLAVASGLLAEELNSVTFTNQSGQQALVKVVGPSRRAVIVPERGAGKVRVDAGTYYILVRFGQSPAYTYIRGEPFTVTETSAQYSVITITLDTVLGGNYQAQPISADDFGRDQIDISPSAAVEAVPYKVIQPVLDAEFRTKIEKPIIPVPVEILHPIVPVPVKAVTGSDGQPSIPLDNPPPVKPKSKIGIRVRLRQVYLEPPTGQITIANTYDAINDLSTVIENAFVSQLRSTAFSPVILSLPALRFADHPKKPVDYAPVLAEGVKKDVTAILVMQLIVHVNSDMVGFFDLDLSRHYHFEPEDLLVYVVTEMVAADGRVLLQPKLLNSSGSPFAGNDRRKSGQGSNYGDIRGLVERAAQKLFVNLFGVAAETPTPRMTALSPASGRVGDVLTMEGRAFDKDDVAEVNLTQDEDEKKKIRVEIVGQSPTAIKFKVPKAAKPGLFGLLIRRPSEKESETVCHLCGVVREASGPSR